MDVPLAKPVLRDETVLNAIDVLENEFFLRGDTVDEFESAFADYVGTEFAISVDSGTRAIEIALEAHGIGHGDRVLTTAGTFIATANAIVRTGAEPVFVDVDLDTYTLDLDAVEETVAETNIDAVVPVHVYGYPVPIARLRNIVGDIPIIADACQAHGASRGGEMVGSMSDTAAFSFYPSKNITVGGDGGIITTDDPAVADRACTLRDVGRDEDGTHVEIGYTARLNTVNAAVGMGQLEQLDEWNERRRELHQRYSDGLSHIDELVLPPDPATSVTPAVYLYVVRTEHRDDLADFLAERGIETGIHYETAVHQQPPYVERGFDTESYPGAEQWADEVLSLPTHPHLTEEEIEYIITAISEYFE